jgi:DNA-binding SARP family transcriptional activator
MNAPKATGPIEREARGRTIARLFAAFALTAFSLALGLSTLLFIWVPTGELGVELNGDVIDFVAPGSAAAKAGLRVGDRLDPKTPFFVREKIGNSIHFGRAVYSFDTIRQGRVGHVTAVDAPTAINDNINVSGWEVPFVLISVLAFLICAIAGAFVVLARPSPLTWSFFLFCIGQLLPIVGPQWFLETLPMPLGFVLQLVRGALVVIGLFALLYFALHFPSGEARGWQKRVAQLVPLVAFAYVAYNCYGWLSDFYPLSPGTSQSVLVDIAIRFSIVLVSVIAVIGTYRASAPEQRQRLKWAVLGIILGYGAMLGRSILLDAQWFFQSDAMEYCGFALVLGGFLAPLAIAYAILKGRVLDIRFVASRAIVYFIITSLLAVALAATYWVTGLLLQHTRVASFVQLVIAVALGVAFYRAYRQLDSQINRVLFKHRYQAQEHLERLAGGLARVESVQELEMLVTIEPPIALNLVCGALYRKDDGGRYVRSAAIQADRLPSELPGGEPLIVRLRAHAEPLTLSATLLRKIASELHAAPLALALPLHVDDVLQAVALYGPHDNGSDLDPQEKLAISGLQGPAERAYASLGRKSQRLRELSELLQGSPEDAFDDTHRYLANQLLDAIPERTRVAIVACAVVPRAGVNDVAAATDNHESARLLQDFVTSSPIVRRHEDGSFSVHGIVARTIETRYAAGRQEMLARCAQNASEHHHHERAAQLFELAGLHVTAAQELEECFAARDPGLLINDAESGAKVAHLDFELVAAHPNLWISRTTARLFSDAAASTFRDGQLVRGSRQENRATGQLLHAWCAFFQAEAGEPAAADASLANLPTGTAAPFSAQLQTVISSLTAGRLGRLGQCVKLLDAAARGGNEEFAALCALVRASTDERSRGRWTEERAGLDYAIDSLNARGSRFVVWAVAEAVAGAWLAGRERVSQSYVDQLEEAVERYDAGTFIHFVATVRGEPREPLGSESPRWLAYAHLIAACSAQSWQEARNFSMLARDNAADAGEPLLRVLAQVACAQFDEDNRYEHLRRALDFAEEIESVPLAAAVRSIVSNDQNAGILEPFMGNLRQDRKSDGAALTIEVASGSVRRAGFPLALSERELAVALALARSRKATSSSELAELIWPDLDETSGLHAVQTCVHRLRQRLGDARAVGNTPHGYRLRDDVLIDLLDIDGFMRDVKADDELSELTTLRLAAVAKHLDNTRPAFMTGWEWFAPIERRIEEWARAAKYRLAGDALRSGTYDRALVFAEQIIAHDELDEPAWEIIIRARIESGDRPGAQRELRRYREITLRELNAEPSKQLTDLLESPLPKRALRIVGD